MKYIIYSNTGIVYCHSYNAESVGVYYDPIGEGFFGGFIPWKNIEHITPILPIVDKLSLSELFIEVLDFKEGENYSQNTYNSLLPKLRGYFTKLEGANVHGETCYLCTKSFKYQLAAEV